MNYFRSFILCSFVVLLTSCSKEEIIILKIASKRIWFSEYKCYLVQKNRSNEWELFYDSIYGFTHIAGHEYVINVTASKKKHVGMDESTVNYELNYIKSDSIKETDYSSAPNSIKDLLNLK